ncbi:MAG: serine/threonine protein kinase [Bryobacterales bacterium]|nr:serine/threonine protein kinase [Bryobacterales bacterium]
MTRLEHIGELFHQALALPEEERAAFLHGADITSSERDQVQAMLAGHQKAFAFFDDLGHQLRAESALPTEDSWENAALGPYRLRRELGRGGMGVVYLGERTESGFAQLVAIKVIRSGKESDYAQQRFLEERRILSRLRHDGIARLYDGGQTPWGSPYLVMEYVEGERLDEYCRKQNLDLRGRLKLFLQVCAAIRYAHGNLVIHRDLKPANVLVTAEGVPKLVDFGIARRLVEEPSAGDAEPDPLLALTPDYAAPEQLLGQPVTTQTDVWGLGLILYELLCGERPFREGLGRKAGTEPPALASRCRPEWRSEVAADLEPVCRKALALRAEDRYVSAEELARDVERYLDGYPVSARVPTPAYRAAKFVERHRQGVAVTALFALVLVVAGAMLAVQSAAWKRERDKAQRVAGLLVNLFTQVDPDDARQREIPAREVLDRGVEAVDRDLREEPEVRAELLDVIAQVYYKLARFEEAGRLYRTTLEGTRDKQERAARLHRWGQVLHDQGKYDEAAARLREALQIRQEVGGPAAAQSSTFLALTLYRKGDFKQAAPLFQAALDALRKQPGATVDLADALSGMGLLRYATGDYKGAEAPLREALTLQKQVYGSEHRQIADTLSNLAAVLSRQGRDAESEPLARESIDILRKVRPRHPKLATALNNLGLMLASKGREAEAEPPMRESLEIRRAILPAAHPDQAQSLSNLGWLLTTLHRFDEAETLLTSALEIRRKAFGPSHVLTADALGSLGMLYLERWQPARAAPLLEEALATSVAKIGQKHPVVAIHRNNRAILWAVQRNPQAEAEFREALAIRRAMLPKGHPHLSWSLLGLGALLASKGRGTEAEPLLWEAVEIRRKTLPEGHVLIAEAEWAWKRTRGEAAASPSKAFSAVVRTLDR